MLPDMTPKAEADLYAMELVFTIIFAVELAINLFGSWFWPFVSDGWNVFDSIVVVISIVGMSSVSTCTHPSSLIAWPL